MTRGYQAGDQLPTVFEIRHEAIYNSSPLIKLTRTSSLNRSLSGSISCDRKPVSVWHGVDKDQSTTYAQTLLESP